MLKFVFATSWNEIPRSVMLPDNWGTEDVRFSVLNSSGFVRLFVNFLSNALEAVGLYFGS